MKIGTLRHRVTLQTRSATLDAYGQQINSWSNVATIWASITPISGEEKMRAMAVESELTHTVTVRYDVRFLPPKTVDAWRIIYVTPAGSRMFNITAVRDINEARKQIVFDVTESSETGQ